MNREKNWKKIPVENLTLKELTISGNGKDCKLTISTKNPEKIVAFEMRDPALHVELEGKMTTESFNEGDMDLGVRYTPAEDLKITLAEIDFPGDDEEWLESLARFEEGMSNFIYWMIRDVRVTLERIV